MPGSKPRQKQRGAGHAGGGEGGGAVVGVGAGDVVPAGGDAERRVEQVALLVAAGIVERAGDALHEHAGERIDVGFGSVHPIDGWFGDVAEGPGVPRRDFRKSAGEREIVGFKDGGFLRGSAAGDAHPVLGIGLQRPGIEFAVQRLGGDAGAGDEVALTAVGKRAGPGVQVGVCEQGRIDVVHQLIKAEAFADTIAARAGVRRTVGHGGSDVDDGLGGCCVANLHRDRLSRQRGRGEQSGDENAVEIYHDDKPARRQTLVLVQR